MVNFIKESLPQKIYQNADKPTDMKTFYKICKPAPESSVRRATYYLRDNGLLIRLENGKWENIPYD